MTDHEFDPELRPQEQVAEGWRRAGYTTQFAVVEGGRVGTQSGDRTFAPEELTIDHMHRYEGVTNPGDEELLVALSNADGTVKGTLTLGYGTYATPDEADVARALRDGRDQGGPS